MLSCSPKLIYKHIHTLRERTSKKRTIKKGGTLIGNKCSDSEGIKAKRLEWDFLTFRALYRISADGDI